MRMRDPRGYYSLKEVMKLTGLSRGAIERLVLAEKFPPKVKLSPVRRGYNVGEVNRYLDDPERYRPPDCRNALKVDEPNEDA
jgi:prophage regulatory protein